MAEFNIKRRDAVHSDSVKNLRGCYKRGDIISVMEDGMAKTLPHLTVIKVPGLPVKDAKYLIESKVINAGLKNEEIITRRRYHIPSNVMDKLFPGSITNVTVPLNQWDSWKIRLTEK